MYKYDTIVRPKEGCNMLDEGFDAVGRLVRCHQCLHFQEDTLKCNYSGMNEYPNHYCSHAIEADPEDWRPY